MWALWWGALYAGVLLAYCRQGAYSAYQYADENYVEDTDEYDYVEQVTAAPATKYMVDVQTRIKRYGSQPSRTSDPNKLEEIRGAIKEILAGRNIDPSALAATWSAEDDAAPGNNFTDIYDYMVKSHATKYPGSEAQVTTDAGDQPVTRSPKIFANVPTRRIPIYEEPEEISRGDEAAVPPHDAQNYIYEDTERIGLRSGNDTTTVEETTKGETSEEATTEGVATSAATTNEATTGVAMTGEATTGDATTGGATTGGATISAGTTADGSSGNATTTPATTTTTTTTTAPTTITTEATTTDTTTTTTTTMKTTTKSTTKTVFDVDALLAIIANLTYDYDMNLTEQFNETLIKYSVPTCATPTTTMPTTTTTTVPPEFNFANTTVIAKCFVCGLDTIEIPRNAYCADAFAGDFIPLVPVDPSAKGQIARYRKYCRYLDVNHYITDPSEPRSLFGRWTGGCSVRWTDLSGVYTQRSCRNRRHATTGRHFASKRMAKLEMTLSHVDNGCIISPMASLVPLSRGISLFARFHACVCTGSWCNKGYRSQHWTRHDTILSILLLSNLYV